ncbi:MAG: hypothetical protein ACREQ2_23330 [Candidatus Binatia bacterium]
MKLSFRLLIRSIVTIALATVTGGHAAAASCTHYASPSGTSSGSSMSQPFKIANFWSMARPGHTLCLLDGQYTGSVSMINPPDNLSGTSSARITVRALNDGKVRINGQGRDYPVQLRFNNYFVIEGINASNSAGTVVSISRSHHNTIRRVAAWDAADGNHSIFGIHSATYSLLEDVAGWGIARKIYESSQGGDNTTIRRSWGRWEGSHVVGPKMTYTLAYNNYNMIVENALGTWSAERLKQSYTLLDYFGKPWTGNGAGTYTNYRVDQPYGIFANDGFTGSDKNARSKLLGSLAYIRSSDRFQPGQAVFITKIDSMEIAHTAAYIEPGTHTTKQRFGLHNLQSSTARNLVARNLTGIGGKGSHYGSDWNKSGLAEGASLSSVTNPFTANGAGANLCFRYKDGVLTSQPLWPWPMNQRIIDATLQSGRAAVDVTATVERLLGPIPAACKTTSTASGGTTPEPTAPSAPVNLTVSP